MPFKSKAQRRLLHAKEPEIAERWEREGGTPRNLPEKKGVSKKKRPPPFVKKGAKKAPPKKKVPRKRK